MTETPFRYNRSLTMRDVGGPAPLAHPVGMDSSCSDRRSPSVRFVRIGRSGQFDPSDRFAQSGRSSGIRALDRFGFGRYRPVAGRPAAYFSPYRLPCLIPPFMCRAHVLRHRRFTATVNLVAIICIRVGEDSQPPHNKAFIVAASPASEPALRTSRSPELSPEERLHWPSAPPLLSHLGVPGGPPHP